MGLLSIFSKAKYEDGRILSRATLAIEEDPVIENPGKVTVSSKAGMITLTGSAATEREKAHIEGSVRSALKVAGIKFADIVNDIVVGR
jgi:hypothetical protein